MTDGWLALVLIGGAVAIVAIAAIVMTVRLRRAAARDAQERHDPTIGPAAGTPGALPADPIAGAAAAAAARDSRAGDAHDAHGESPELHGARLQVQQQLVALAFGRPLTSPAALSLTDQQAIDAVRATLLDIAERPNYAPRRPLLLPRLMQAINDEETSRRELARIIASDPALAGNLLRLANSPFYRVSEPVESLDRAVALLGLAGLRSLIASALLQPVFRIGGGMFPQFGTVTWEHTLYSAHAAEAHAAVLENSDPFAAQLLALIMGLGAIVVFRVATDEFLAHQQSPRPALLASLIEQQSAAVGRRIAASWELSERIDTALADQCEDAGAGARTISSLGRSLRAGRFVGALALLQQRAQISEEQAQAALRTAGAQADALLRIWARLIAHPL